MNVPKHFRVTTSGILYDTRESNLVFVRENYARHHNDIKTVADLKAILRAGKYTFPGGYPLFFFCANGGVLSFESVRENLREVMEAIRNRSDNQWHVLSCGINWENPVLVCDHSGEHIESAYGE